MGKFEKDIIFTGAATALVTPFYENGAIDYKTFAKLIDFQINSGIDALVICGTTGEGSTLSDREHRECIRFAVEHIAGRVPVIAGTGSNDIDYANSLSKYACDVGADALLLVTPYYNKATPLGLIKSFLSTADAVRKPIILYNVPSRTGVNITMPVYRELAKHERIVAVKEASGNISHVSEIAAELSDSLAIYSGNDDQIVPILSLGGRGVISVLSNILPKETHDICEKFFEGDISGSRGLQLKYLDLVSALFCEVNPVPVKTACEFLGLCGGTMRLPLCEMESSNRAKLISSLKKAGVL